MEKPVLILKYKSWLYYFAMVAMLCVFWLYSFGTILPYLLTGDFNQIWPANDGIEGEKIILFISSILFWLYSPLIIPLFYIGDVFFFEKYIEQKPYVPFFSSRIIGYNELHITIRRGMRALLTTEVVPKWYRSPCKYFILVCWNGFSIPVPSNGVDFCSFANMVLINPEDLPQAIQMVREKSVSITDF